MADVNGDGGWAPMALDTTVPGPVEVRTLHEIKVKGERWILGAKNGYNPIWIR
ncbi:MAG: hypothetical protein O2829_00020 [Bacteroidetes bacterium]|nr:hypothetical protein [Bacteroidota bacterium]MDA1267469.1 hypothetical protein [Bacteroidota bacterium]